MRFITIVSLAALFIFMSCESEPQTFKVAFGSCGHQNHPQPILAEVVKHRPDLFVYLGDNIYSDTYEPDTLRSNYAKLGRHPGFKNLRANMPVIATWDDHDYGWNDAGRHYPHKEISKEIFLEFWQEPIDSERRDHPGIYHSYYHQVGNKTLQIILLDMRTFRDDLRRYNGEKAGDGRYFYGLDYSPYETGDSTLLGEEQWKWLEGELQKPADIRLIGSSTQFSISYNGYEAWANVPHERQRMLDLIKTTKANGVLFMSGDVHYAEISKIANPGAYPIYDLTASGLSSTWHFATPNFNRIEGPVMDNHFGLLTITVTEEQTTLHAEVWDVRGNQRISYEIPLAELTL
jgi:alkaline phosphatase D